MAKPGCALLQVYVPGPRISSGGRMPSTKIIVRNDGPLRVEGEIELVDMQGQPYGLAGRTAIALCRCGHSANKPFCDGRGRWRCVLRGRTAGPAYPPARFPLRRAMGRHFERLSLLKAFFLRY